MANPGRSVQLLPPRYRPDIAVSFRGDGGSALPAKSCLVDGEIIAGDETGPGVFDLIRGNGATHVAFDLLELDGKDLRGAPIGEHKGALANLLRRSSEPGGQRTTTPSASPCTGKLAGSAAKASCPIGLAPYGAGRLSHWIKVKNPAAPAVKREAEEEWR